MPSLYIDVDYDPPNPATYRAVKVRYPGDRLEVYATGNPPGDFLLALMEILESGLDDSEKVIVTRRMESFVANGGNLSPVYHELELRSGFTELGG